MLKTTECGYFLLELIVATFIFSSILAIGTSLLTNQLFLFRNKEAKDVSNSHVWLSQEAIRKASQSSNLYWGSVNMFASPNGRFVSRDGTQLNIEFTTADLRPAPNSTILTFREVIPSSRLEVISARQNSNDIQLTLCGRIELIGNDSLRDLQNWLALTVDGNYPLIGTLSEDTLPQFNCSDKTYRALLRVPTNAIFPAECYFCSNSELLKQRAPIVILEVRSEFSLYVDQLGKLRIYSHTNHFNQAISSGILKISAKSNEPGNYILSIAENSTKVTTEHEMILNSKYDPRIGLEMLP